MTGRRLRIGLLTPVWPGEGTANGIATAVRHLHAGLVAAGHVPVVLPFRDESGGAAGVVPPPPARPATLAERVRMRLGQSWLQHRIIADRVARAAREAVRRHGIEVLVMEETWGWAAEVQRALPIPVVVTLHGPWFLHKALQSTPGAARMDAVREARERAAILSCAGVTAPSRAVLTATQAQYGPFSVPTTVIPNPIPLREPVDFAALAPEARRSLLFVGRFDPHKGGDTVLEGFARLIRGGGEARLTFVGPDRGIPLPGGGVRHVAEALAALPEDVRTRVDYLGQRSAAEVTVLRRRHGIALVASRYETFGNVAMEAMAVGAAVVATRAGGLIEMLRHGETGLLVPPGDSVALANACARLLGEPGLAPRLGAAARKDVEKRLSPEVVGRVLAEFLVDLTFAHVGRRA